MHCEEFWDFHSWFNFSWDLRHNRLKIYLQSERPHHLRRQKYFVRACCFPVFETPWTGTLLGLLFDIKTKLLNPCLYGNPGDILRSSVFKAQEDPRLLGHVTSVWKLDCFRSRLPLKTGSSYGSWGGCVIPVFEGAARFLGIKQQIGLGNCSRWSNLDAM